MPIQSEIRTLVERLISGTLSEQDRVKLYDFLLDDGRGEEFKMVLKELGEERALETVNSDYRFEEWEPMVQAIMRGKIKEGTQLVEVDTSGERAETVLLKERTFSETLVRKMPIRRLSLAITAAASIVLLISIGAYLKFSVKPKIEIAIIKQPTGNDVAPGTNKAVLVLGNGSKIILDSAQKGLIANQSGSSVVKTDSGKLAYNISNRSGEKKNALAQQNTLSTPRGGQYQLTLPDGTKVWLNAASSITYPTAFNGKERKVSITGEAYFEVLHNDKQPFTVSVNGMEVKDIGTHFNINSYPDESGIKTTLIEGSIRVTDQKTKNSVLVSPGQQADFSGQNLSLVKNINTSEVISWKEGSFDFESADLKTILRQFARWYDVDVVYEGTVTNKKFFAIVSRNTSLKKVLELLQDNNIKYEIKGKKLMIKSN